MGGVCSVCCASIADVECRGNERRLVGCLRLRQLETRCCKHFNVFDLAETLQTDVDALVGDVLIQLR